MKHHLLTLLTIVVLIVGFYLINWLAAFRHLAFVLLLPLFILGVFYVTTTIEDRINRRKNL